MSANTVIKPLKKAWTIAGQKVTEIELREPTVADMIDAEKEANPNWNPNAYKAALAAITIVRAGTYTGPFAPAHFKSMGAANWRIVETALMEAEQLGEDVQQSREPSA